MHKEKWSLVLLLKAAAVNFCIEGGVGRAAWRNGSAFERDIANEANIFI